MCGRGDAIKTGNGKIAPDHQTMFAQLAHRAKGDNIVVADRRARLWIQSQCLADAIAAALTCERDVDEPVGRNWYVTLAHGAFKSRTPEVVDRSPADAAEEGNAAVALLNQMTSGAERPALVVCTDEVVTAGSRLAYHNHQRDTGLPCALEQRVRRIERRTQDHTRRVVLMHGGQHFLLDVEAFIGMRHQADVTGVGQSALHADQHFRKEWVAKVVDHNTDDVR